MEKPMAAIYKVAGQHIVHQNIIGEIIVVDLRQGAYFSLTECGPFIWEALISGASRERVIEMTVNGFHGQESEIRLGVEQFLQQLVDHGLLSVCENEDTPDQCNDIAFTAEKQAFVLPTVQKYDDMEDFLVLDPIHDFDEAGWPNAEDVRPPLRAN
jgi:hypothetical protein